MSDALTDTPTPTEQVRLNPQSYNESIREPWMSSAALVQLILATGGDRVVCRNRIG